MLQLRERKPYQTLTRWAEKYGPIYRLRIGALNVVVLNSDDLIKEVCTASLRTSESLVEQTWYPVFDAY